MLPAVAIAVLVASPAPLKEIIRVQSTPFCTAYRENIFGATKGLMLDDGLFDQGVRLMGDPAHDAMDQYRLGLTVYKIAQNLTRVYALLSDPVRFPKTGNKDEDNDLALMRARLVAVADAQERSLNVLSGTYESNELNDLLQRKNPLAGERGPHVSWLPPAMRSDSNQPRQTALPKAAGAELESGPTSVAQAESLVAPAVVPAIQRCNATF